MTAWAIFTTLVFVAALAFRRLARATRDDIDPAATEAWLQRRFRLGVPTVFLTPCSSPGFSKLGGEPELPDLEPWPQGLRGPMAFLAEIDLAAAHAAAAIAWLPDEGRLFLFHDPNSLGSTTLVHSKAATGPKRPIPRGTIRHPERRVGFLAAMSYPSDDWLDLPLDRVDCEAVDERLAALAPTPEGPRHRMGGYPDEIQGGCLRRECEWAARGLGPDPERDPQDIEEGSRSWRLLFQIDSDADLKIAFGDGGSLYVFIREEDARLGDFSRTVTIFQGY